MNITPEQEAACMYHSRAGRCMHVSLQSRRLHACITPDMHVSFWPVKQNEKENKEEKTKNKHNEQEWYVEID